MRIILKMNRIEYSLRIEDCRTGLEIIDGDIIGVSVAGR